MSKELENVHHQLSAVQSEAKQLSSGSFTEEQLRHLQNKLHHIDEQYKEGCVMSGQQTQNSDPYEVDGQAEIAEELEKVHQDIYGMLNQLEK